MWNLQMKKLLALSNKFYQTNSKQPGPSKTGRSADSQPKP